MLVSLGLMALSGLVAYEGWRVSARRVVYGLGPGTVPYFVAASLLVLAIGTLIAGIRGTFPERDKDLPAPVVWIVAGLVAQLVLLRYAGFSIATGLLFAATAKAMGRGPLWMTVPIGFVLCFVIWVVFTQALNLSLPAGPIEEAFLSAITPAPEAPVLPATPPPAAPAAQ
ncbi:tripartite tricarboxylate transporter TctB family protein [Aureimonas sp. Leaf454]|uniref:tripartite tricarboxylate transporter TctB family protein n=1 Tax=Aureimonas sp. Leaf454 TaxID=1736381 RepID=UPI001FCDAAAF|nr:tripartite tricarboxylate transporter TctB family protein [Aureimonas sp. Leaf454]